MDSAASGEQYKFPEQRSQTVVPTGHRDVTTVLYCSEQAAERGHLMMVYREVG
jgi:hypothetical protein